MDKAEVNRISDLLDDVLDGICQGREETTLRLYLTEVYAVIRRLTDAAGATNEQDLRVLLAMLRLRAKQLKYKIEERLAVRN